MSQLGHSLPGRANSKFGLIRYAAESGSQFRALATQRWAIDWRPFDCGTNHIHTARHGGAGDRGVQVARQWRHVSHAEMRAAGKRQSAGSDYGSADDAIDRGKAGVWPPCLEDRAVARRGEDLAALAEAARPA